MWSLLRRSLNRSSRREVRGSRLGQDNTEDRNTIKQDYLTRSTRHDARGSILDSVSSDDRIKAEFQGSTLPATFRQSLQLRHLDCGSCNGCDWELTALNNSFYDLQRFGIDFVASPRHADLLMCTGTGSTQLLKAARETYEAMAKPKWVMAVGDCAIDGGMFKGAYASEEGLDKVLPVDFKVPGCPPSPDDIMDVLKEIMGK